MGGAGDDSRQLGRLQGILDSVSRHLVNIRHLTPKPEPGRNLGMLDADAIAQRIFDSRQASSPPLQNRGQLARVIGEASDALPPLKRHQEAVGRALADVLNFRRWNLMIDVITQSGSFPDRADSAADFIVTGESRLRMHVAIDRVTGKIIDVKRERVDE